MAADDKPEFVLSPPGGRLAGDPTQGVEDTDDVMIPVPDGSLRRVRSAERIRTGLRKSLDDIHKARRKSQPRLQHQKVDEKILRDKVALNHRSLFLFSKDNRVRLAVFKLTHHRYFEALVIFLIFANCVTLAMDDPTESKEPQWQRIAEWFFTAAFALEMCLKVFGQGLILHPGSYLRNGWNVLDFLIVVLSALALFSFFGNYSAFRMLRVLRPLRSINGVQGLKNIVNGLLFSVKKLVHVILLTLFLFFIFGIVGVQLWKGLFTYRCQMDLNAEFQPCVGMNGTNHTDCISHEAEYYDPIDPAYANYSLAEVDFQRFCKPNAKKIGFLSYFMGRPCDSGWSCVDTRVNPNYGYTSFDNIGYAFLAIFQCITMEGWVDIMYIVQDVWGNLGVLYFVMLIVLGSFFVLNLALAVINEQFNTIREETQRERLEALERMHKALMLAAESLAGELLYEGDQCLVKDNVQDPWQTALVVCGSEFGPAIVRTLDGVERTWFFYHKIMDDHDVRSDGDDEDSGTEGNLSTVHDTPPMGFLASTPHSHSMPGSAVLGPTVQSRMPSIVSLPPQPATPSGEAGPVVLSPLSGEGTVTTSTSTGKKEKEKENDGSVVAGGGVEGSGSGGGADAERRFSDPVPQAGLIRRTSSRSDRRSQRGASLAGGAGAAAAGTAGSGLLLTAPTPSNGGTPGSRIMSDPQSTPHSAMLTPSAVPKRQRSVQLRGIGESALDTADSDARSADVRPVSNINRRGSQMSVAEAKRHRASSVHRRGKCERLWYDLRWACYGIVSWKYFQPLIIACIVINTGLLAAEHHNQPHTMTLVFEQANVILTMIFTLEMLLKLLASGFKGYVEDPFNVLDGVVVIMSLVEFAVSGSSTVSVFRALRLLRVFKLLKNFPGLRKLITVCMHAVRDTGYLNLIILLYIFIAALVGMQFFGGKFDFPERGEDERRPRPTYDSFYWSFLTVFQILTRDDWVMVMWDAMLSTNGWSALYFLTLVVCGDFLILNLFLAILIQSFDESMSGSEEDGEEIDEDEDEPPPPEVTAVQERVQRASLLSHQVAAVGPAATRQNASLMFTLLNTQAGEEITNSIPLLKDKDELRRVITSSNLRRMSAKELHDRPTNTPHYAPQHPLVHRHASFNRTASMFKGAAGGGDSSDAMSPPLPSRGSKIVRSDTHHGGGLHAAQLGSFRSRASHDVSPGMAPLSTPSGAQLTRALSGCRRMSRDGLLGLPHASDVRSTPSERRSSAGGGGYGALCVSPAAPSLSKNSGCAHTASTDDDELEMIRDQREGYDRLIEGIYPLSGMETCPDCGERYYDDIREDATPHSAVCETMQLRKLRTLKLDEILLMLTSDQLRTQFPPSSRLSALQVESILGELWEVGLELDVTPRDWETKTFQDLTDHLRRLSSLVELRKGEEILGGSLVGFVYANRPREIVTNGGNSLCLFGPENPVRVFLYGMVKSQRFENFILVCIVLSSLLLAVENPNYEDDMNDDAKQAIYWLNNTFTIIFFIEMCCKVIAYGFIFGKDDPDPPYLRDSWNVMDMAIVIVSVLSWVAASSTRDLAFFRIFRTFRALRPLRVISRNRGLRMVVITLMQSIGGIGNVAVISFLVFLVFGILGVQLLAGKLYFCTDTAIRYREACYGYYMDTQMDPPSFAQRRWVNKDPQSFDDIRLSLLTLFEISTLELWSSIMYNCLDAVSTSEAPRRDANPPLGIFFIVFVVIGSFFILNLFVGVVIHNYNEVKVREDGLHFLSPEQKLWIETQRMMLNFKPVRKMCPPTTNSFRHRLYNLVRHNYFDIFIGCCITLNVMVMALEREDMTWGENLVVELGHWLFTGVFITEAAMKITAYGKGYFGDSWNKFDFALVALSVFDLVLYASSTSGLPMNTSILRVFRIFRIMRILRLVKAARDVRILLETVWYSLPSIANIGAFLALLFFIYAILGVNQFAKVKRGEYLTHHANFETFPNAILLLFRMVTGENWNGIMHDTMVRPPECGEDGADDCGSPSFAPFYYCSFLIMAGFVLTNLFVAIILDNFATTMHIDKSELRINDLHKFIDIWADFDPNAQLTILTLSLPKFLEKLGPPLGISRRTSRVEILKRTRNYCIPEHGGKVHFIETIIPLARHVMNQHWQDNTAHKDLRDQEDSWRQAFPDINNLPILRVRQRRATADQYFASTYIMAAYRRRRAIGEVRLMRQAHLREMTTFLMFQMKQWGHFPIHIDEAKPAGDESYEILPQPPQWAMGKVRKRLLKCFISGRALEGAVAAAITAEDGAVAVPVINDFMHDLPTAVITLPQMQAQIKKVKKAYADNTMPL